MAKWIEYLLKKKPADEDMLMLEDAETHNNKRVSFSGIADWLIEKMKKNNLISGALRFKGSSSYAALPGKGAAENDYYYCSDGDGTHGPGYYAWNGSSWIWIGNNDKGIDKSLKVEGAAAEAAATGEAIASLKSETVILKEFSLKEIETVKNEGAGYYASVLALDPSKIYAIKISTDSSEECVLQAGTSASSSNMVDTLAEKNFLKDPLVFGYVPTGKYQYLRLATKNNNSVNWGATIYDIIGANDAYKKAEETHDGIYDDLEKYVYKLVPYDRQLFDKNTMIPESVAGKTPRLLPKSNKTLVDNSSCRSYVIPFKGNAGDRISYNFIFNGTLEEKNVKNVTIVTLNEYPTPSSSWIQASTDSSAEKRGYIALTEACKYLLLVIKCSVTSENITTAACNAILDYVVVRKGGYDTTYYDYEEHADYKLIVGEENLSEDVHKKLNSQGTDEEKVKELISETVPAWAMRDSKPAYTPSEIGALSKSQGSDNKGKILVIGADGSIIPGESGDITEDVAIRYHPFQTIHVGDNLIDKNTDVILGANWSGDIEAGYTHTSGAEGELIFNLPTTSGAAYLIDFIVSAQAEDSMGVTIGNEPYCDPYNGSNHYYIGIVSDGGKLKIKGLAKLATKITDLYFRKIGTSGTELDLEWRNVNHGQTNNLSGFWNIAIGDIETMAKNQNGSRNIAMGHASQRNLKSGTRNIAIGTYSMPWITEGDRNIAIGADTLYDTGVLESEKAYDNVAIGKAAVKSGSNVSRNIGIGTNAMGEGDDAANQNVCVGYQSGYYAHSGNTNIGSRAGYYTKGNGNTNIGKSAGADIYVTGDDNVCIGNGAGYQVDGASAQNIKNVNNSIAIGAGVKAKKSNEARIGKDNQTMFLCGKKIIFNSDGTVTWESE